ncbi:MAG: DUF1598 domain-containing protein [Planctomycetales bacterium]|nr:DUF1598 domain-containing protein [Planctomycetales bacterium]
MRHCFLRRIMGAMLVAGLMFGLTRSALAQGQTAGVFIDADGVLSMQYHADPSGALSKQRAFAARSVLDGDVATSSELRKVSLNRLEAAIAKRLATSSGLSADMTNLAGLTRLKYVFFYPESGDIVVAGPAEGWMDDLSGRTVGIQSGQPTLKLEDLIVALRMYAPDAAGSKSGGSKHVIGCSIDPTQEGLARMQAFLRQVGVTATPSDTDRIVNGLRESLGLQNVSILGVSANTHFAQVMVEADYRMKLIGIGLEQPPIRMASYVQTAQPADVSRNAMQRWYFVPDYECVRVSDDGLAMELVGDGVKLVSDDEVVTGDGVRRKAARVDKASQMFVTSFTKRYGDLARRSPVFAQLRNLIDIAIAAAYIKDNDLYSDAGWDLGVLADESRVSVEHHAVARQVQTAVASVWRGNQLMTPVGGGVHIEPEMALSAEALLEDDGKLGALRSDTRLELADGQWWWD